MNLSILLFFYTLRLRFLMQGNHDMILAVPLTCEHRLAFDFQGLDSRANLRKRCGASLMNLLRKYHTRSSAVADVHRKSALRRFPFESSPTQKKKSKPNRKGLLLTFLGGGCLTKVEPRYIDKRFTTEPLC